MVDIDIETAVDLDLQSDLSTSKYYVRTYEWKYYGSSQEFSDDLGCFSWEDLNGQKNLSPTELKAVNCLLKGLSNKEIKKRIKGLEGAELDKKADSFRKTIERVKNYFKFVFVFKEPVVNPCMRLIEKPSDTLDNDDIVEYLRSKQYSFLTQSQETPTLKSPLFGRKATIKSITQKILTEKKSLLLLKGALGIGKKSLSRAIALNIQNSDTYQFYSIDFDGFAHSAGEAAYKHFIQKLLNITSTSTAHSAETIQLTDDDFLTQERATIIERLTSVPKVIVLDDFEKFSHEDGDPFYVFFSDFLKAYTGSVFIINSVTSVAFVEDLAEKFDALVFQKKVKGLDSEAAANMLLSQGLKEEKGLTAITETYNGNPGQLRVIAKSIKEHFDASPDSFAEYVLDEGSVFLSEFHGYKKILDLCSASAIDMLRALNKTRQTEFTFRDIIKLFGASANSELRELLNLSLLDEVERLEEGSTTYRINRVVQRSLEKYFDPA